MWSRFDTAVFSVFMLMLAGCGGGGSAPGGGTSSASAFVPLPAVTQAPSGSPVAYMQSTSPLTSSGTVLQGTHQALVAVMSNAAQAPSAFAADTLSVSGPEAAQSAVRSAASGPRQTAPSRIAPVEAFPADDRLLAQRLRTIASNASSAPRAARTAQGAVAGATVGQQALIWVQKGTLSGARTNVQVSATLEAQTAHGNIWIDDSIAGSLAGEVAQIGADFENAYASDTAHFASPDYTSGAPGLQPQYTSCSAGGAKQGTGSAYITEPADHRINVMIVASQNLGGLGGYFSSANYMRQSALNCLNGGYESNEAPFIFVGWFAGNGTSYELQEDLVRSAAHELQHLINFVNHGLLAAGASSASFDGNEVPFINEGLSMLAQDLAVQRMYGAQGVQFDVADALQRAGAYLANPGNFSVSGFTGIDTAAWGGDGTTAQFNCGGGCYGAAYLYERYLRDRFGGDAYTHAMETSGSVGTANLQSATAESASSLLDDFALAMGAGTLGVDSTDPRFGFGTLNLTGTYRDQFGGSTTLAGVYAVPATGASTQVRAPVGGFAYVAFPAVPAAGMPVQVTDRASASGFGLTGGLAQRSTP